ncbi:MAG TPA: hypothetical protein VKO18_18180 [Terriglobia bacterium]|nr:hypothetical protein [Terriglobia bacterium]
MGRTVLLLLIIMSVASAVAVGQARKKSRGGAGSASPDDYLKPALLNADANPTLRYPVASFSGWSVKSTSYGWFDVTRNGIRYGVVQPAEKMSEGFDMSVAEITDLKIEQAYLMFHRGTEKKRYALFYLSQDRWGTIHSGPGSMQASSVGALGTASMFQAIRNFDNVLAMVKPPAPVVIAPVVAAPVVAPPPEPKPAPPPPCPPAIALSSPPGAGGNQTIEWQESTVVIRGVAMDSTGIPVVRINGSPANMRPQTMQAAEFWSDPLPLQAGSNHFQIVASNSAHVEAALDLTVDYKPKTAPVNPRALGKEEILSLLQGGVPVEHVADLVRDRGIKFTPSPADLNDLRAAGGSDDLIQAIQQAAAAGK